MYKILVLGADNSTIHLLRSLLDNCEILTDTDPVIFKNSIYVDNIINDDDNFHQDLQKLFNQKSYEPIHLSDYPTERQFDNFVEPKTSLRHYHKFTKPYNKCRQKRYC